MQEGSYLIQTVMMYDEYIIAESIRHTRAKILIIKY